MSCTHPNLIHTARVDLCPNCGYEFYYGDAHASGDLQLSKLINPGNGSGSCNDRQLMMSDEWPE